MICNKFTAWLDEGNTGNSTAGLPAEFAPHVAGCSRCQKLLAEQNNAIRRLTAATILSGDSKQKILAGLEKRIELSQPASTSPVASLLEFFFAPANRKPVFAGVFLAAVLISLILFNLPGSGEYHINAVSSRNQQLAVGDRLICAAEKTRISWNSQDQIEIDGQAEFIVGKNRLKMLSGMARMTFSPSARGYEIEMQKCTLSIVGTIIKLEMTSKNDRIAVEKGMIKWQHHQLRDNGMLAAGQSISVSAEQVETVKPSAEPDKPAVKTEPALNTTAEPVLPE